MGTKPGESEAVEEASASTRLNKWNDTNLKCRFATIPKRNCFFCLEPWADEKIIPSKKSEEIDLMGPIEGTVAVEFGEQKVTLSGWPGSICEMTE